jgi:hypothetical protein
MALIRLRESGQRAAQWSLQFCACFIEQSAVSSAPAPDELRAAPGPCTSRELGVARLAHVSRN